MEIRITYTGNGGTLYSEIEDYDCPDIETGEWVAPFPNEKGGSTMAFGLAECLEQSGFCPMRLREEGLKGIKVELNKLKKGEKRMYKLPQDSEKLQDFAEKDGRTYAKSLPVDGRANLNTSRMANAYFSIHVENSEEQGESFCNDLEEGREIFEKYFKKGFREFE